MATYANSLKNQKMFEDFLANNISTKIELSNKKIVFDGGVPWAPELQNAINNFPLISVLVPRYMNYDWTWGKKFLEKNTYTKTQTVTGEEYEEIIKTKKVYPYYRQNRLLLLKIHRFYNSCGF